jgi:hypothetical protein
MGHSPYGVGHASFGRTEEISRVTFSARVKRSMFGTVLEGTTYTLIHGLGLVERRVLISQNVVDSHGLKEVRREGHSGCNILNSKIPGGTVGAFDGRVDQTLVSLRQSFTFFRPDMIKIPFITFSTGLCIGINPAICNFPRDGLASVFHKIKATFTLVARIFPMESLAIGNLKFFRNRRAAFARVVQEVPGETQVTGQVIRI